MHWKQQRQHKNKQRNVGWKWDKSTKIKVVGKTKIDRIKSQQIRKSYAIQPTHECVERRREWDEHITRMDAVRLDKIS